MAEANNPIEAVKSGNLEEVKSLLDNEPDIVNTKDNKGYTLLHLAAQEGNGDLIKLLLERGADINALTEDGQSPMEIAIKQGHDAAQYFSL
ncbi:ankyrin repeat domain-containing protein [Adhaeribacter aquaticus]|uniref:ankyrin repeat domain-containing protein n=1 Tax=Adhaeribacter aquaticus TaxID=299567 RepID=UPI0004198A13|nr:ankyrin repeat domain-containing protein [Adhaeribacter aquaticus]